MCEIVFEIEDVFIALEELGTVQYGSFLNIAWVKFEIGPHRPKYVSIKKGGETVLRFRFLFRFGDVYIGRKV